MDLFTVITLGAALSMDAFAISICEGMNVPGGRGRGKVMLNAALWFGVFQGLMPFLGYLLGNVFASFIQSVSGIIACLLLSFIGGNMIKEARSGEEEDVPEAMDMKTWFMLAVATSIDAMASGITFSVVPPAHFPGTRLLNTAAACLIIAVETGLFSAAGVRLGAVVGEKFQKRAQLLGGVVLILIGLKILFFG